MNEELHTNIQTRILSLNEKICRCVKCKGVVENLKLCPVCYQIDCEIRLLENMRFACEDNK
jgi:hypothetical protein